MYIRPKKSLGQNFLDSTQVINAMLEASSLDSHDIVVEAGPGKGILTEGLLSCARLVIAVEKDPRLLFYLALKFKKQIAADKLKLIEGNVLNFDPAEENLKRGGYKVISNIPYYLTGQFLRYFLSHTTAPSNMVLLLQKEVVERIVAKDGKESILSIAVKAYGSPDNVGTVSRELFTPKPRVDSAILRIEAISKKGFERIEEERFFEILRLGFSQKRKKLSGNLSPITPKESIEKILEHLHIPRNARAEELPLSKWKQLVQALHTKSVV